MGNIYNTSSSSSSSYARASSNGIGFVGLLTIVFITLKLIGVINWSWVWVLSPLWIAALFWAVVLFILFAVMAAASR